MSALTDASRRSFFDYRALRLDGSVCTGVLAAASASGVREALQARSLFPIGVTLRDERTPRGKMMNAGDSALGLRILADLLDAKLPVAKVMSGFSALAPEAWQEALPGIQAAIWSGDSLASALDESTLGLDPVVITMIAAGELGSNLASGMSRAADLTERSAANRNAVRNALAYPMVLACTGAMSLVFLVGFVLPRFASIIADIGGKLPRSTQMVLAGAAIGHAVAFPMIVIIAVAVSAWRVWVNRSAGRIRWHSLLLGVPLIGAVRRSHATARAASVLGTLVDSGVLLTTAMSHAASASGDAAIHSRLIQSRESVTHGERLSDAIAHEAAMTETAVLLIKAGEETGRLGEMLARVASIEQTGAERRIRAAVRLLEPALILAFGVVVAFVAAALLQAVYSVRPG